MNQHEQKIRQLLTVAEAPDARQAAYRAIAEEIDAWMREDDTLTFKAVGARFGKSDDWAHRLSQALSRSRDTRSDFVVDWKRGNHGAGPPARLDNQVKLAQELLANPDVADAVVRSRTPAARAVNRAVSVVQHEQTQRMIEAGQTRRAEQAVPIEGHLARIAGKLGTWNDELLAIKDDLADADETLGTRMVMLSLRELGDTCHDIANTLDPDLRSLPELKTADEIVGGV